MKQYNPAIHVNVRSVCPEWIWRKGN